MTSAGPVIIRKASDADLAGVLALYAQPEMDDGDVLYVVEADGRIVGSFALLIMDNLGHLGAPSAIVEDVVVDPAQQSHGIGSAMMRFAIERAQHAGCYKLALSSNAARKRAHAFYESLGFERHGYSFRIALEPTAA